MPVTINGTTGIAGPDGSASTPAVQGTDSNTGLFFPAADTVGVTTGGAEAARINSSGTLILKGGSTSATGVGITFPADTTTTVSSNANTLDDYEEGTWSPTCSNGSTFTGNYIKIGKIVHLFYSTSSSGTITANSTTLTGLPFTVDSSSGCGVYANVTSTANFGGTQTSSPTTLYFLTSSSSAALRGYHPYYVA